MVFMVIYNARKAVFIWLSVRIYVSGKKAMYFIDNYNSFHEYPF